jgi:hypothetical protein
MATIVAAVGAASGTLSPDSKLASKLIQEAMANAVTECVKEGISLSDSETIRGRMMAARELVKKQMANPSSSPKKRSGRGALPKQSA